MVALWGKAPQFSLLRTLAFHVANLLYGLSLAVLLAVTGLCLGFVLLCICSWSTRWVRVIVAALWRAELAIYRLCRPDATRSEGPPQRAPPARASADSSAAGVAVRREVTGSAMVLSLLYFMLFKAWVDIIFSAIPLVLWSMAINQVYPYNPEMAVADNNAGRAFAAFAFSFLAHQVGVASAYACIAQSDSVSRFVFASSISLADDATATIPLLSEASDLADYHAAHQDPQHYFPSTSGSSPPHSMGSSVPPMSSSASSMSSLPPMPPMPPMPPANSIDFDRDFGQHESDVRELSFCGAKILVTTAHKEPGGRDGHHGRGRGGRRGGRGRGRGRGYPSAGSGRDFVPEPPMPPAPPLPPTAPAFEREGSHSSNRSLSKLDSCHCDESKEDEGRKALAHAAERRFAEYQGRHRGRLKRSSSFDSGGTTPFQVIPVDGDLNRAGHTNMYEVLDLGPSAPLMPIAQFVGSSVDDMERYPMARPAPAYAGSGSRSERLRKAKSEMASQLRRSQSVDYYTDMEMARLELEKMRMELEKTRLEHERVKLERMRQEMDYERERQRAESRVPKRRASRDRPSSDSPSRKIQTMTMGQSAPDPSVQDVLEQQSVSIDEQRRAMEQQRSQQAQKVQKTQIETQRAELEKQKAQIETQKAQMEAHKAQLLAQKDRIVQQARRAPQASRAVAASPPSSRGSVEADSELKYPAQGFIELDKSIEVKVKSPGLKPANTLGKATATGSPSRSPTSTGKIFSPSSKTGPRMSYIGSGRGRRPRVRARKSDQSSDTQRVDDNDAIVSEQILALSPDQDRQMHTSNNYQTAARSFEARDLEIHGRYGESAPRLSEDYMNLHSFGAIDEDFSTTPPQIVTCIENSPVYRGPSDPYADTETGYNSFSGDYESFTGDDEYDTMSATYASMPDDADYVPEELQQVYRSISYAGDAAAGSRVSEFNDLVAKRDKVHFNAFAPPHVSPSHKPFYFTVWGFLLNQREEMKELAEVHDADAKRLSVDTKLDVRRGALVHVTLETPPGFRVLSELTQGFVWEGKISNVTFDVECTDDAPFGPVLFKANIIVGAEVAVLHAYVNVSGTPVDPAEYEVKMLQSWIEVMEKKFEEIPYPDIKLDRIVGSGYFGDAYLASYKDEQVVVKTIRASEFGETNDQIIKEFQHEAAMLSMFGHHPCVVPFVGASSDTRYPLCLVTQYLPHGSLEANLKKPDATDRLSTHQRTLMLKDAAAGFLNIHEGGFMHRDIAARNCLVDDDYHVKICDFGLTRRIDAFSLYMKNDLVGPIKYMAPESLGPSHSFSTKSDSYMFGVLMWETFTASSPFASMTATEAMMRITRGERLAVPAELPRELRSLMESCFRDAPDERPTMCQIMYSLMDSAVGGRPQSTPAPLYEESVSYNSKPLVPFQPELPASSPVELYDLSPRLHGLDLGDIDLNRMSGGANNKPSTIWV